MNRLSNFELVRIIAMCLIVMSHYAQHGLYKVINLNGAFFDFLTMYIHSFGQIGVVLFVLLTGYFMVDKKFNIKHVFSIIFETVFYSWGILFILLIFFKNYFVFTPMSLYRSILPISTGQYWFVTIYLMLYILIPLLNKLFNAIDKDSLKRYLFLLALFWCILPTIGFKISFGESHLTTFIYLYFLGAYVKRYGILFFEKKLNALVTIVLAESTIIMWTLLCTVLHLNEYKYYRHLSHTHSIFIILVAVSIFVLLKNVKLKHNFVINYFASSAFAVYLITENIFTNNIIWTDIFHCNYSSDVYFIIFNMIFAVSVSYIVCTLIDKVRIKLFEQWLINIFYIQCKKIYSLITKFI